MNCNKGSRERVMNQWSGCVWEQAGLLHFFLAGKDPMEEDSRNMIGQCQLLVSDKRNKNSFEQTKRTMHKGEGVLAANEVGRS